MVQVRVPDAVQVVEFGDGLLLRDPGRDVVHRLNRSARWILALLTNGVALDDVVAAVGKASGSPLPNAGNEVRLLVGDLVVRGLLETGDATGAVRVPIERSLPFYPWYDSYWLAHYVATRESFRQSWPDGEAELDTMFGSLRTNADFETRDVQGFLDADALAGIRAIVAELQFEQLERHETERFGRGVVHNQAFFNEMQAALVPVVSELAGEALEVSYNFLSLYGENGVCAPHMDAPNAKYTLDMCIDQSEQWPIYVSQVVPWPEQYAYPGDDWARAIVESPDLEFREYVMDPGDALFFSGSSQFHYRMPHPGGAGAHCTLLFFHFVPARMKAEVEAFAQWS